VARKIESLFSVNCKAPVWESALSESKGLLLLQTRDEAPHVSSFTVVDLSTGKLLIRDKVFEEPWWIGISVFFNYHALLHIYDDEQNPEKKSLMVWDTQSDSLVSTFKDSSLIKSTQNGFAVRRQDEFSAYDWQCHPIDNLNDGDSNYQHTSKAIYPFHYQKDDKDFPTIRRFVEEVLNVTPEGGADYLEYQELVLISYHIRESQELTNYLLVSDQSGEVIFHQKINTTSQGLGRDTFFIFEQKLIFITDYKNLAVYEI